MEKRGIRRGRHGQASQVWTIVRSLVRPSPTLISLSTRLHPSGSHWATAGLTSWLESSLIIAPLDVRLLALFSGSARFLCPCVRQSAYVHSRLCICSSTCYFSTHQSHNLFIPIDISTSIHLEYKLQLTRATALTCMMCSIFIWISI